ncbi:MAG: permease [Deltaproteobacteria bacterium]|nr:permease [Deltaproteobacteria bacterium]
MQHATQSADPRRQERLGLLFAALCALNGAFVPAVAKLTTAHSDAVFVATVTTVVAGVCALLVLVALGEVAALWARGQRRALLGIGTLGTAVTFLLFFEGARRSSAVETALCLQIEPVYSLFLARLFLGHPLTPRRLAAVLAIVAGIALALNPAGFSHWIGNALLLVTPLGWQISHLIVLRGLPSVQPRTLTAARYVYGGAVLALLWFATGGVARLPATPELLRMLPVLVLQGAVLSFVGTLVWYGAIARLDLARCTAIVVPSVPLLSLGASWLLLGEVASTRQWVGLLLTACGVVAFVTAPHATSPDEEPVPPSAA